MKKKAAVDLNELAGGAFAEKVNEALYAVAENIQNPNTNAEACREITVKIKFKPSKNRQIANASIAVGTKLAQTESVDTQVVLGVNYRTGDIEIGEYRGQVPGQMTFADLDPEETEANQTKPIDLRTRRTVDKETGEILAR